MRRRIVEPQPSVEEEKPGGPKRFAVELQVFLIFTAAAYPSNPAFSKRRKERKPQSDWSSESVSDLSRVTGPRSNRVPFVTLVPSVTTRDLSNLVLGPSKPRVRLLRCLIPVGRGGGGWVVENSPSPHPKMSSLTPVCR